MSEPFNHIALHCNRLEVTEAFYTRHFGFKRSRVFFNGEPNMFLMLRKGNCRLELFKADCPRAHVDGKPAGFSHLAFNVPDIAEAIRRLNEDGVQTEPLIENIAGIDGLKTCFFNDPDGNRIELMEGYTDDPALWS